jgi:hypothetical protein
LSGNLKVSAALDAIRPDPQDPARDYLYKCIQKLGPEERRQVYEALFGKTVRFEDWPWPFFPDLKRAAEEDPSPDWKEMFRGWIQARTVSVPHSSIFEAAVIHGLIYAPSDDVNVYVYGWAWTGPPAFGPLSWLVLVEMIAFFVSFFQLRELSVGIITFCIIVGVCLGGIVLYRVAGVGALFPRDLALGNLDVNLVIPLSLYIACLVRIGLSLWQGRASFFTRVANHLAVSLMPGLVWLATAFRTEPVFYDYRYFPPEVYWSQCATVFVLIPGLSCICQYVTNKINSFPE